MPRVKKVCKVCGKSYEGCHTPNYSGIFRWRDVACCYACAQQYIAQQQQKSDTQKTDS